MQAISTLYMDSKDLSSDAVDTGLPVHIDLGITAEALPADVSLSMDDAGIAVNATLDLSIPAQNSTSGAVKASETKDTPPSEIESAEPTSADPTLMFGGDIQGLDGPDQHAAVDFGQNDFGDETFGFSMISKACAHVVL